MHECPHCNKPGIGIIRKLFIGPKNPATCHACGGKVFNHPKKASVAAIPVLLSMIIQKSITDGSLIVWMLLSGLSLSLWLTEFWVPLEKAGNND